MCTQRVELGIDGIGKSDVWTLRDFQCGQTLVVDAILRVNRWNDDHVDDDLGCHRDTPSMECKDRVGSINKLWRSVG